VVTGANGGLGLESAKALAAKGAHVVMASRNQDKAARAADEIRAESPRASLEVVPLNLASLASVRAAAERVMSAQPRVDILVNNAGVMAMPVLLTALAARVVSVTSTAHHFGRAPDPADPHMRRRYQLWLAYGQSKLAYYH
jgi:NAD(P)-dependent dehydrogenase (short-subunit alcohol dehydrogenase family)